MSPKRPSSRRPPHTRPSTPPDAQLPPGGPEADVVTVILGLPAARGERFSEEWAVTRGRIERVAAVPVSRDTDPAGAPRLSRGDG